MCGICGIFEPERTTAIDCAVLKAMSDAIAHRGPDDEGHYCAPGIGLGFRRLSIIDVAGGHQPLSNEDGTVWIAFNGEIYNFEELNRRYLSSGHTFRTRSDTETIVHLYEELGEDCFAELRGMFAIALWDGRRRGCCWRGTGSARSRCFIPGTAAGWCSAPKSKRMWPAGGISKEIDLSRPSPTISPFNTSPLPRPSTAACGNCGPAHYLVVEGSRFAKRPIGTSASTRRASYSEDEWCEAFLSEYRTAVKSRLVSDVPLGHS